MCVYVGYGQVQVGMLWGGKMREGGRGRERERERERKRKGEEGGEGW